MFLFTLLSCVGYVIGFIFGFLPTREKFFLNAQATLLLPKEDLPFLANRVFGNLGRNFMEIFYPQTQSIDYSEADILIKEGTLILTAHFGNWELLGLAGNNILKQRLYVIARKARNPVVHYVLEKVRYRLGVEVIWRDNKKATKDTILQIKRTMKNHILCALIDQDTHTKSVFTNFFGIPASTPTTLLDIACKENLNVVMAVLVRLNNSSLFCKPKFKLVTKQIHNYDPQMYSDILEELIREYPDNWVWFHKRWRTQPGESLQDMQQQINRNVFPYYRLSSSEYKRFLERLCQEIQNPRI